MGIPIRLMNTETPRNRIRGRVKGGEREREREAFGQSVLLGNQ